MKKIALITQYYKPEIGAPQNRLFEMVMGLRKHGCDISVITAMPNYPSGKIFKSYKRKFFQREELDGIEIRRHWLYASNSKRAIPRIISMLSFSITVLFSMRFLRVGKFDALIVESPPLTLGLSGYLLSRICKAKLILNISDLWPLSAKELGAISDGFLYGRLEKLEKYLYKKSILCMGQSQEIVDYMATHGAPRTFLFRNGVSPERFKSNLNGKRVLNSKIVYTGLLGVAQGILDICKNINFKVLGLEFHIYGAGVEQEDLEAFLERNPHRGITYHGTISRSEIPEVLSQHSATLIPLVKNIYGAVPSKIYESMAAGLPILYSGEGEARSIIEEHNLGWTSPARDFDALMQNLMKVNSNGGDLDIIRKNCLKAADTLFNRPKQIDELYQSLNSLM